MGHNTLKPGERLEAYLKARMKQGQPASYGLIREAVEALFHKELPPLTGIKSLAKLAVTWKVTYRGSQVPSNKFVGAFFDKTGELVLPEIDYRQRDFKIYWSSLEEQEYKPAPKKAPTLPRRSPGPRAHKVRETIISMFPGEPRMTMDMWKKLEQLQVPATLLPRVGDALLPEWDKKLDELTSQFKVLALKAISKGREDVVEEVIDLLMEAPLTTPSAPEEVEAEEEKPSPTPAPTQETPPVMDISLADGTAKPRPKVLLMGYSRTVAMSIKTLVNTQRHKQNLPAVVWQTDSSKSLVGGGSWDMVVYTNTMSPDLKHKVQKAVHNHGWPAQMSHNTHDAAQRILERLEHTEKTTV